MSNFKRRFYFFAGSFLLSVGVFMVVSLLSHKNNLSVDGAETYGFPLTFSSSCGDCIEEFRKEFILEYLILDFVFILILIFSISYVLFRKK